MTDRHRILLAETDRGAAMALAQSLQKTGFDVSIAGDAAHVLNLARQEKPDVIVLSGQLAGGGLAVLKRLRSNVYTAHIPIVAIAGRAGATRDDLLGAGAQECIGTPVDYAKVRAAVDSHLLQSLDFTQAPPEVLAAPERLADLEETGLLDSPPQESFDLLTRLTAKLLGAPVALVTLVDKDRQFFKSQCGLAEPWAGARQSRLSHSFCQWVVSGKEELVVRDANSHPTLKHNLAIQDMNVVAYAGVPIRGRSRQAIGSFCAIDSKPRDWSEAELALLRDLAAVSEACAQSELKKPSSKTAASAIAGISRILRSQRSKMVPTELDQLLELAEKQALSLA